MNAPVAVNSQIFFSDFNPTPTNTCAANLGEAKAYAVSPFTGRRATNVLQGGGLPPSAVSGLITIVETNADGSDHHAEKFCIGCGISGSRAGGTNTAPCPRRWRTATSEPPFEEPAPHLLVQEVAATA